MKISDVLRTALMNLWRRKARTFLTILGMVIGVASIVVMVSLGLGIQKATIDSFAGTGSLTMITVTNYRQVTSGEGANVSTYYQSDDSIVLNNKTVDALRKIEGVVAVMPTIECWGGMLKSGRYVTDISLLGVDMDVAAQFDIVPETGSLPESHGGSTVRMVLGSWALQNFYDPNNYNPAMDNEGNPKVTADSRFQLTFDSSNIYGGDAYSYTGGQVIPHGKFYRAEVTGVMGQGNNSFSWYTIMDIDMLKKLAKENKDYMYGVDTSKYSSIYVKCVDIDAVESVRNAINELGYGTESVIDAVNMAKESTARIQYLLGAIGGVALLVAAIGIMNTMMMSIYERTKEIGIIKVLGCRMSNIVELFLTEAAYIGLFGGALGLGVSYGISMLLNVLLKDSFGLSSVIPLYLAFGAVAFSIVVAVVSGMYPAFRAMRLSPLAALRNE